ncbi:hypothetical protein BVY11_28950 [Pseudomonas amygdali pv. morsprunorum]|nr:hypothetical protein BVY11_28950 [Pseudomonas amygdali pv. morsprunorum]PPS25100.1 hypothetical protein BVY12_29240 [Pseudomonas amygdali pv. morsprunorum]
MSTFFDTAPCTPLVKWLPDETLFSLCSRQHVCSGNWLSVTTSRQLFGLSQRCIKHDLAYGLDAFEQRTRGFWGTADSILTTRTILPFFAPFQSQATMQSAVATLKGNHLGSLKYRLGLVTGGFGAEHPLKVCNECLEEDIRVTGIPYWRLAHQYPGVLLCPVHGSFLCEVIQNRHWCERFSWGLPSKATLAPSIIEEPKDNEIALLTGLAQGVLALAALGFQIWFDPLAVSLTYRRHLVTDGSFIGHVSRVRRFHPFERLPASDEDAMSFIKLMTRKPRRRYHPLKHLLMITWLFGTVKSFTECYFEVISSLQSRNAVTEPRTSDAIQPDSLITKGEPRPKKLKTSIRNQVMEALAQGTSKQIVCTEFSITVSTVNKLLRMEPSLKVAWQNAQFRQQLDAMRSLWTKISDLHAGSGIKALRALSPATYAWLYRNDRDWLMAQHCIKNSAHARIIRPVDWEGRDIRLRGLVESSLYSFYSVGPQCVPLSKSLLFSLVPILASSLESSRHYSCTRAYIAGLLRKNKFLPIVGVCGIKKG